MLAELQMVVLRCIAPCHVGTHCDTLCCAMLQCAELYCAKVCRDMLCCAVLCYDVPSCIAVRDVLCLTVLCSINHVPDDNIFQKCIQMQIYPDTCSEQLLIVI